MAALDLSSFEIPLRGLDKGYAIELTKVITRERHYWVVGRDYHFEWNGIAIFLPKGFETDLASIPRILRGFISKDNRAILSAVVHDLLYREALSRPTGIDRSAADECFKDIMEATYVGCIKRNMMWTGVRAGGQGSWKEKEQ